MSFEVKARIGLDSSMLIAGLEQGKAAFGRFGSSVGSSLGTLKNQVAAAFSVVALEEAVRNAIEFGGKINDLSARTRESAGTLQMFNYVATQTSASLEDMVSALKKLAVARSAALSGDKTKQDEFLRLGYSLDALKAKQPRDLFFELAEGVRKSGDEIQNIDALLSVMGKNADVLFPAMRQGIADMAKEFESLGLAISDRGIKKLDEFGDKIDQLKLKSRKLVAESGIIDQLSTAFDFARIAISKDWKGKSFQQIIGESLAEATFGAAKGELGDLIEEIAGNGGPAGKSAPTKTIADRLIEITSPKAPKEEHAFQQATRNFDSLARIGGFAQNTDQIQAEQGRQVIQEIKSIHATLKEIAKGGYTGDGAMSLLGY